MNTEPSMGATACDLLRSAKVFVAPETFTLISLSQGDFAGLLRNSNMGPSGDAPYLILWDKHEVTLLLNQRDFALVKELVPNAKTESGFRLLTFDLVMDFSVVGFLAEVARILATEKIAILAISAFSRDHILIKQDNLAGALKILGQHVADLC